MSKGIPPTVRNFITVLVSKLTDYDEKTSRREKRPNIYRLGHLLEAAQRVESEVLRHAQPDEEMTQEIADHMFLAMNKNFTVSGGRDDKFDLPPLRNVVKQLEAYLATKKNPSLVR